MQLIESLPFLHKPLSAQVSFWRERGLIDQQNRMAPPIATIDAMSEEMIELAQELVVGNTKKIYYEAVDVGIFAFTAEKWNPENWQKYGSTVVEMVQTARRLSGLSEKEFAYVATEKIEEINKKNHHPIGYCALPSHVRPNEVLWVYGKTRPLMKELRYLHPDSVMPDDLGMAWSMGERMKDTLFADSPFYHSAIEYLTEIKNVRAHVI